MISEFLRSLVMIFIAELGDKTQLIAMTFATQFSVLEVLIGVALGVFLNHGIAVLLGQYLNSIISIEKLQIFAGFLFILLGILSLKDEEDEINEVKKNKHPIVLIAIAFFIGELGDKTQLTAMTLSSESQWPFLVLLGTTSGLVLTSSLGIFLGSKLGKKVPEIYIKIVSSVFFILIGSAKLTNWLPEKYLTLNNIVPFALLVVFIEVYLIRKKLSKRHETTLFKETSEKLYRQTEILSKAMEDLCLGLEVCKSCKDRECMVGYSKALLKEARKTGSYTVEEIKSLSVDQAKKYDEDKLIKSLSIILNDYIENGFIEDPHFIVNIVKSYIEILLVGEDINELSIESYLDRLKSLSYDKYSKLKSLLII